MFEVFILLFNAFLWNFTPFIAKIQSQALTAGNCPSLRYKNQILAFHGIKKSNEKNKKLLLLSKRIWRLLKLLTVPVLLRPSPIHSGLHVWSVCVTFAGVSFAYVNIYRKRIWEKNERWDLVFIQESREK